MSLVELKRPYEILEIDNNKSVELNIVDYEEGTMVITPRPPNPQVPKTIITLRVFEERDPTIPGLEYWDITSQTLIAQLAPILDGIIEEKKTVRISAFGVAPKKRFTVQVL